MVVRLFDASVLGKSRMSAQTFVGGLGAVAPEAAAFFDKECKSCAVCETCKGIICNVLG
jgi:hypothetical protein